MAQSGVQYCDFEHGRPSSKPRLFIDHLNPIVGNRGLSLNITDSSNALDYQLAFEVVDFFRLSKDQATTIYDEVLASVRKWQKVASRLGISCGEMLRKQSAFNV